MELFIKDTEFMNGISSLKNATAVVTGATGFIGSHLVDYLVGHGCTVHALVRETSDRKVVE